MNERLISNVDLDKYPIHDLNTPIIYTLIERCKDELDFFAKIYDFFFW